MSIKERRVRQKQATRTAILAAARKLAREEGWAAVTIRHVAEMIEYSPPVIYEYFESKDALLGALQQQGFDLLADSMRQSGAEKLDPEARLLEIGKAYWRFAQNHTELYHVMHGWESMALPMEETLTGGRKAAAVLNEVLEAWALSKETTLPDLEGAVETLWGLMHGLVSVALLDRLNGGMARGEKLAQQAAQDLLFAWAQNGGPD